MKNIEVKYIDLGLIDYKEAWDLQEEYFKKVVDIKIANRTNETIEKTPNYLIFCQHPHVFTLGKSGKIENLLVDENGLEEKEASFYKINRGGDITYHGPGQLVVYPILDLDNFFTDIHKYMRFLEEAVILTCADFGIKAGRIDGLTGVWIDDGNARKICAMGVKSSRWVTMHGLALNVNTDLSYFSHIVPCGIDDKTVSSFENELKMPINQQEVAEKLKTHLANLFEMELI
ncbi:MAG: lipoyl(octanoyl) transferase LipB [Leadbetterella sp.]|jgi:lipoyl(octanoyl) transferase|nr:lipoyl(octanoyl) transferase LipB [Leadbetterella sp.]